VHASGRVSKGPAFACQENASDHSDQVSTDRVLACLDNLGRASKGRA